MAENNNDWALHPPHTAWISRGFEWLEKKVHAEPKKPHFDVLIVGSGYGGAVAADTFARCTAERRAISVGVLERGNEYLSGAFPAGLRELPRHIRQKSAKEGLFDIRLGPEVTTVVANGVGGGSLINAGVMEVPAENVFAKGWPKLLASFAEWQHYFDEARERLGSRNNKHRNTILGDPSKKREPPKKYRALEAIAPNPEQFRAAEITIAVDKTISSGNVALNPCLRCGDCATGCNFGAKNSLDVNLLVRAQRNGAQIFSGATVLKIEHEESGYWLVHCVHTNVKLRERSNTVSKIRASKVILAAGVLGSTEILLRSKEAGLPLSKELGRRCSTNGDMLIAKYATNDEVNTVADEAKRPSERGIGPTITGIIDLRTPKGGIVIEEMTVPAGLRRAFGEVFATVNTLHALNERDCSLHRDGLADDDNYYVTDDRIDRSALYAVMGDDGAAGEIELVGEDSADDGVGRIRWSKLPDHPIFEEQVKALTEHTKKTGGRLLPNPVWKLLPADMSWLLKGKRGPLITVHPLGGCAMADRVTEGVVDDCGRVFDPTAAEGLHKGLVVLDGSIIPTALGINPALTIAAVALRAAEKLATAWDYRLAPPAAPKAQALLRPMLRSTDDAFHPTQTEVEVIERLAGAVTFRAAGQNEPKKRIVEITLRFAPKAVTDLCQPSGDARKPELTVSEDGSDQIRSRIRIFDCALWNEMEKKWTPALSFERELEALALFSAPLTGSLRVLARTRSHSLVRVLRAGWAWLLNRGMRDVFQAIADRNKKGANEKGSGFWARLKGGIAVASRGGELRVLDYALVVGIPDPGAVLTLDDTRIEGRKRFTYNRRASPWRQLMEVELEKFPGLERANGDRVLTLDLRYLARIGVPLFRIVKQNDGATALTELASFFGYVLRLLIGIHIWSFRKPDEDYSDCEPNRMPSKILDGLPKAEVHVAPVEPQVPDGAAAAGDTSGRKYEGEVILTRFANPKSTKPPLLMLHGYSASGTTFAHRSVPDNFASCFWKTGRDVWIADLRTSSGQEETAKLPWSFEQIGTKDIPAAFAKILAVRKLERTPADQPAAQPAANEVDATEKIDVIAHCMGAVVFSMAVLGHTPVAKQVGRAALTQVGPLVVFSPVNIFRAYVLRYLIDFLPDDYSFRPDRPSLADDLFDRLLATLPYPIEEFDIENPLKPWARTPWTRTRHRMDALYGRDFNVANMEPAMLRHIDDHFGPLSLRTVAQTLHFVRFSMITTFAGDNNFIARKMLADEWKFPTFSVHGATNGLAHVSTVDRMRVIFEDAGRDYRTPHVIANAGHQDALVGNKRAEAIAKIKEFLDGKTDRQKPKNKISEEMVAYPPWIGPIITEVRPTFVPDITEDLKDAPALAIRLGTAPTHHSVEGVVMIRVRNEGERAARPDRRAWNENYVLDHMVFYGSQKLRERWDAMFAPRPELMPGGAQGDALLVLVVYSDSVELAADSMGRENAYFRRKRDTQTTEEFWPLVDIDDHPEFKRVDLEFAVFKRAARALLKALLAQTPAAAGRNAASSRPGHPVLLAAPPGVSIELPIPKVGDLPPLPPTAQLLFGVNDAHGQPRAAGALEHDPGVADGVIPDKPPPTAEKPKVTRFALMSCQYPAGLLDEPAAEASYRRILEREDGANFLILTGDQVYVDPTAGLYDPSVKDDRRLRRPYELWLQQPSVRKALRSKPSFMLLDDHEIADNWEPLPQLSKHENANDRARQAGVDAYNKFQRAELSGIEAQNIGSSLSFFFHYEGFPFFMLDTRTARTRRRVGEKLEEATLFDKATFEELENWLKDPSKKGPKFVVTPSMLLPRHANTARRIEPRQDDTLNAKNLNALHSDGWDGYPSTLSAVLGVIAKDQIENVVFLSGDEHRGCVATIDLYDAAKTKPPVRVYSLHTTAAYAPYPFANSLPSNFVPDETIGFRHGDVDYKCSVTSKLIDSRDGALLLCIERDGAGAWVLKYEYADGTAGALL